MIKTPNYLDLIIFNLLLIANEILLRYFCLLPLFTLQALLFDLGFYLLLSGILILFNKKIRKVIEGLLIFLSSVYSFAQSFHYAYFKTLFSFRKLSVSGEFMEVLGEIFATSTSAMEIKIRIAERCAGHTRDNFSFYLVPIRNVKTADTPARGILSFFYSLI